MLMLTTRVSVTDRIASKPSIQFKESEGYITIPKSDQPDDVETFKFNMSNISKDNNSQSFECIQQSGSGSEALQLSCLGTIKNKITVCPTSESIQVTRERVIQAEEADQKRSAKFVSPDEPAVAKRKLQLLPDAPPKAKKSKAKAPAAKEQRTPTHKAVVKQPYKDRIIHLLALRNYKKPELLFRLQRDGISPKDRDRLGSILHQVATLNPKDNSYILNDYYFTQVRKDWPGYTDAEKQSLELILSRRLNASQDETSSTATAEKEETSSPPYKLSWSLSSFDPLLSEKLQKAKAKQTNEGQASESSSKTATAIHSSPSCSTTAPAPQPCPSKPHPPAKRPQTATSSSSSAPKIRRIQELPIDIFSSESTNTRWGKKPAVSHQKPTVVTKDKEKAKSKPLNTVVEVKKREEKKQLTKEEAAQMEKRFCLGSGVKETCTASKDAPSSTSEQPDYLLKYVPVVSREQRQSYENDFNAEFDEYRRLHAQIDAEVKKFTKFQEQWKLLSPGSQDYMALQKKIIDEYQKLQQASPSYSELKQRGEYLHKKLSHIKSLVEDFDRQQGKSQPK
ncbi:RNA polymerase II elongation factor ELL2 [Pogoniulus pusillus]|uniref:RNA polymerase II elongation factor ELL2 n=1 Tax=Pogoniulus pusillus TaxID=488313 RepID=UPI0030B971D2